MARVIPWPGPGVGAARARRTIGWLLTPPEDRPLLEEMHEIALRESRGTPLRELDLSFSLRTDLMAADIYTVEELLAHTDVQLAAIRGVGPARMAEIRTALASRGHSLPEWRQG